MQGFQRPGDEYGTEPHTEYLAARETGEETAAPSSTETERKEEELSEAGTSFEPREISKTERSINDEGSEVSEWRRAETNEENSTLFAQAFACEPDRGYNAFFERLEEGRHSFKILLKHIQTRIDIEEEYTKKLYKWSHESRDNGEIGPLKAAIDLAYNEFDSMTNSRIKMVDELKDRVLAPMQSFSMHYKHIRESRRDALLKSIKSREDQEHNVLKHRKHYDHKCHEAEQISFHQKKSLLSSGSEKAEKVAPKLERHHTAVEQAEREYRLAEEKLRLLTTAWETDMIQFAEDFQSAENEHINQLKSVFIDLCDIYVREDKLEINEHERIRNAFNQVENLTVIKEFINHHAPRQRDVTEIERSRTQTELLPLTQVTPTREKSTPFDAKVLYGYKAQKPEELTLEEGGIVRVISMKDTPWWEGEFKGTRGVFPSNYVARVA